MSQTTPTSGLGNLATDSRDPPQRVVGGGDTHSAFCPSIPDSPRLLHFRPAADDSFGTSAKLWSFSPIEEAETSSASAELARKIDGLHQQLHEVTAFLGQVQNSLMSVLSVLEDVEHNVKALSNQTAGRPLVRLPVPPELSATLRRLGKSLRDEPVEAATNEERRKKPRADNSPQRGDGTDGATTDKTVAQGEQEPQEPAEPPEEPDAADSSTDC